MRYYYNILFYLYILFIFSFLSSPFFINKERIKEGKNASPGGYYLYPIKGGARRLSPEIKRAPELFEEVKRIEPLYKYKY